MPQGSARSCDIVTASTDDAFLIAFIHTFAQFVGFEGIVIKSATNLSMSLLFWALRKRAGLNWIGLLMIKKINRSVGARSLIAAFSLSTAVLAPLQASSQEITLRSIDTNTVNVTGNFVSFTDNVYQVDTALGLLNIRGDNDECIGDACPRLASADGPVVWDVSLWCQRRAFTEHVEKLAELVDEKTAGAFTLNLSYGGLAPSRENLDGIAAGAFEMAQFCAGYHPEKNPSITVLELPFLGIGSLEQELAVQQAVYEHPAVIADLARWNATVILPTPQPQYNIIGVGSPPTSFAAFQDLTVRATGGTGTAIQAMGAATVNIPAPQVNEALSNGEINAVAFAPHAHMSFNTIENALWWTSNLNPGTANCPVVMNTDALNSLSASNRVALMSSVDEALDHFIDNYTNSTMAAWEKTLSDENIIQLTINDEIVNAINSEVAGPSVIAWINENDALGLPARDLYRVVATAVRENQ